MKDEPVTFLFVGGGAARDSVEKLVKEKNLSNVLMIPRVTKQELAAYWSLCDASLVHLKDDPVFSTVIPSKIFESMAVGLPIIYVGPDGEGDKIVLEHEAGLTIPAAQPDRLVDAVRTLKNDTTLRQRLAKNSERAAPLFSRDVKHVKP